MAPEMVEADGLRLAVWRQGDPTRPTVVLVHGYPDTHRVWDGVAAALAGEFHVVTYDVRGAGASERPADRAGYDLSHLVADLHAVIDAVSPDQPVHLVGHDWGSIQGWDAVTDPAADGRIASYTSMSGPLLDHVAWWMRAHRSRRWSDLRILLRQGLRSWYVAMFQVPILAESGWRTVAPRSFRRYLHRVEGVPAGRGPGATLADDGANGVQLYRQNVPPRMADPSRRTTDVPVQLLVATDDRFVTPALLDGIEQHVSDLRRRDVAGGHWLPVVEPERFAGWVAEHVRSVEARRL